MAGFGISGVEVTDSAARWYYTGVTVACVVIMVKVKVFLCAVKRRALKAYWAAQLQLYLSYGSGCSASE